MTGACCSLSNTARLDTSVWVTSSCALRPFTTLSNVFGMTPTECIPLQQEVGGVKEDNVFTEAKSSLPQHLGGTLDVRSPGSMWQWPAMS